MSISREEAQEWAKVHARPWSADGKAYLSIIGVSCKLEGQ